MKPCPPDRIAQAVPLLSCSLNADPLCPCCQLTPAQGYWPKPATASLCSEEDSSAPDQPLELILYPRSCFRTTEGRGQVRLSGQSWGAVLVMCVYLTLPCIVPRVSASWALSHCAQGRSVATVPGLSCGLALARLCPLYQETEAGGQEHGHQTDMASNPSSTAQPQTDD